jgi:flavin reductase (DIM6/NTAB) family NADH-FMN oxidoreductase RutF
MLNNTNQKRKGDDVMIFQETDIREIDTSAVKMINDDWALVTAGSEKKWNTMTISWGGLGELWGEDVAFVFIRPQRYTYEFVENNDLFSVSFFGGAYKKELSVCGSKSGRNTDKAAETGLVPLFIDGTVSFEQAETVLICKKIAFQDINPAGFLDAEIEENYPSKDYHRMYVGKILKTYKKM